MGNSKSPIDDRDPFWYFCIVDTISAHSRVWKGGKIVCCNLYFGRQFQMWKQKLTWQHRRLIYGINISDLLNLPDLRISQVFLTSWYVWFLSRYSNPLKSWDIIWMSSVQLSRFDHQGPLFWSITSSWGRPDKWYWILKERPVDHYPGSVRWKFTFLPASRLPQFFFPAWHISDLSMFIRPTFVGVLFFTLLFQRLEPAPDIHHLVFVVIKLSPSVDGFPQRLFVIGTGWIRLEPYPRLCRL